MKWHVCNDGPCGNLCTCFEYRMVERIDPTKLHDAISPEVYEDMRPPEREPSLRRMVRDVLDMFPFRTGGPDVVYVE